MVINVMVVEAIVAAIDEQYIDELREDYVGYKTKPSKQWSSNFAPGLSLQTAKIFNQSDFSCSLE